MDYGVGVKILLWNTRKNKINSMISQIIQQENADYISLVEYDDNLNELLALLNQDGRVYMSYITIAADGMVALGKIRQVKPGPHEKRYSIQVVANDLIICCVHLSSKIFGNHEDKQLIEARSIVDKLERFEKMSGICNTIVMGDFNANPYEKTCLDAGGFHALPIRDVVKRESRIISDVEFKMFYNPTWNLLGDFNYPPGTFYHNGNETNNPFWHLLDQVIIRPSLISRFNEKSLKIIHTVNEISITDVSGHPEKNYSDHFPIIFEIEDR